MPQPFTSTEILLYGSTHGFKNDLRFFFRAIAALDDQFLEEKAEEINRKSKSPGKPGSSKKRAKK